MRAVVITRPGDPDVLAVEARPVPAPDTGEVVALGPGARALAVGDHVFGLVGGAYAEYVVAHERTAVRVPDALAWAEAAAVPDAVASTTNPELGRAMLVAALGWTAWPRHVTLAMLADAYLAVVRTHAVDAGGGKPAAASRHSPPSSCHPPCPRYAAYSGASRGPAPPSPRPSSRGPGGVASTSSAPLATTGNDERAQMISGCSTRA